MGCAQSTTAVPDVRSSSKGQQQKGPKHAMADNMIVKFSEDVKDRYEIIKQVGEGSISNIYLVKRKLESVDTEEREQHLSENLYALKEIDVSLVEPRFLDEMRNEINLMKLMDHPNILKCFEVYESMRDGNEKISIVMEFCSGGDLGVNAPYSEERSKSIVAKLCEALTYLHKREIMHRDLKFENIMFEVNGETAEPKIIDFGLAQKYSKGEQFQEKVGTVITMSPEAIRGDYDFQTDMWSIGVIAYMLLAKDPPFGGDTRNEIAQNVVKGSFNMDGPRWAKISKEAKAFIKNCLQREPSLRYTPEKALKSPWLRGVTTKTTADLRASTRKILGQLDSSTNHSEFKKLVLNTIAHKASSADIIKLRDIFHALDTNHDGTLTLNEIRKGIAGSGIADEATVTQWFRRADADAGGEISYTEFVAALLETQGELHENQLTEAFHSLDRGRKGFISRSNLRAALGVSMNNDYLTKLLQEADIDGDGKISYDEFKAAINQETSSLKESL